MKHYYKDDYCTIYHGDCAEILPHMEPVDLVLTDPPYGILKETGSAATRRSGKIQGAGKIAWDIAPDRDLLALLICKGKESFIWGGLHLDLPPTLGYLVWDKKIDNLNFGECEVCWTTLIFAPRIFRYRAVGIDGGKEHPTQKPLALISWCIGKADNSQTILDPFMGSGTTLRAAKDLNRKAIGIEIEEKYCEIAAKRLQQEVFSF